MLERKEKRTSIRIISNEEEDKVFIQQTIDDVILTYFFLSNKDTTFVNI